MLPKWSQMISFQTQLLTKNWLQFEMVSTILTSIMCRTVCFNKILYYTVPLQEIFVRVHWTLFYCAKLCSTYALSSET